MRLFLPGVLATATSLILLSSPVTGQTIPSPFEYLERRQEIGPFFGVMDAGTGRFDFGPSGGVTYGARYALELSGPLALEGVTGLVEGERKVVDPSRVEGDRIIGESDTRILLVDAALRFTFTGRRSWHGLAPFISLGGGLAMDMKDPSQLDETLLPADVFDFGNSFHGTLGAGTRWFITDALAVRLDGVFSLWKLDTPPGFSEPDRAFENVADGEWVAGQTLSLTLLYRW